jgi:hypothetical protein
MPAEKTPCDLCYAPPATTLPQLDEICLQKVLEHLSAADRRRLSRTCHSLRQLWRNSIHSATISQDDLELHDDKPLCAFPHLKQLQLNSIDLDQDFSAFLQDCNTVQQLRVLQVINPQQLQPQALCEVLATCSRLTSLQLTGDWRCDEGEAVVQLPHQRPASLQQLHVLRNSSISPSDLRSWLSAAAAAAAAAADAPDHVSVTHAAGSWHNSSSSEHRRPHSTSSSNAGNSTSSSNSKATASAAQQQLLRLLAEEAAADGAAATAELALLQPAWPYLQELDLSGELDYVFCYLFLPLLLLLWSPSFVPCRKCTVQQ